MSGNLNHPMEPSNNSRVFFFLVVGLLLITTALRMINLDADPVPWFTGEIGYQVDEGYKTLSPRNLYLYGQTHWNSADLYSGWMTGSALTQWPYYLSFKLFGEDLSSARIVSVIYAVTFLIIAAFFLWQRLPHKLAVLGIILLATDPALFLFSRSALFETSLIFYTYTGIFIAAAFAPTFRQLSYIPLILITILSFFYLKKTIMLYMTPVILSYGFVSVRGKFNPVITRRAIISIIIFLLLIGVTLYLSKGGSSANINLEKFIYKPQALFLNPVHILSPLALIMAYTIIVELLVRQPKFILNDWYRLSLTAVVVLTPIMLSFFTYNAARYQLPILPAALLLIVERLSLNITPGTTYRSPWFSIEKILAAVTFLALAMTILSTINYYIISQLPFNIGDDPGFSAPGLLKIYPFFLVLLTIFTFFIVKPYWNKISIPMYKTLSVIHIVFGLSVAVTALAFPNYDAQQIRSELSQQMKPDESVGGDWAPFFVANTKLRGLYMRPDRNSADIIEDLRPNYFLSSGSAYDNKNLLKLKTMKNIKVGHPVELGVYAKHTIYLHSIKYKVEKPNKLND